MIVVTGRQPTDRRRRAIAMSPSPSISARPQVVVCLTSSRAALASLVVSNLLRPPVRQPLSLEIADRLRAAILAGEIPVNSELPTEINLSKTFGVGRSTVREALRVLQSQGLVTGAETVSTTRPRATHSQTTPTAVKALEIAMQVRAIPLDDLVALRVLLESSTARSITCIPTDVRTYLDEMREAAEFGDLERFNDLDVDFHLGLARAAGNEAVSLVLEVLRGSIAGHLRSHLDRLHLPNAVLRQLWTEHRGIVAAIDAGDAELASERMTAHIRDFYARDDRAEAGVR